MSDATQPETSGETKDDSTTIRCKVLIVGGGMAGLSAAYHLARNGYSDFHLLEARNRLGGRIVQIPVGNEKVELGANWIHGILGNPVYELAMEHGLVDIMHAPTPHKVVAATEAGKQVPFNVLHDIYEAYLCFLRRCEEYFVTQYAPPDGIDSVGDHIRLEIQLYLDSIADASDRHLRQLIFDCLLKRETCISGCDNMSEIDLLEIGSYTELQGGNIILPQGYSAILDPVSKHIDPSAIHLRHPVTQIRWNLHPEVECGEDDDSDDSDRTVIEEPIGGQVTYDVEVTCENGRKFLADHVICTIPLGVLKHRAEAIFQPALPSYKLDAIDRLLFGTVDKIILEYDRPFLNPSITEVLLLWDDAVKTGGYQATWFKKIYSFSKISDTLLMGWISGKEAEYMETLPSDVVAETCTGILRKFLNDPFIPKPRRCVCTSWYSQPYTKGSYTAIAVGASQIDIECLAQPLYTKENQEKPVLLFAGEHTHSNFYSTVHGAYLTGRTAAKLLLSPTSSSQTGGEEIVIDCVDTTDLSSWIQGIELH